MFLRAEELWGLEHYNLMQHCSLLPLFQSLPIPHVLNLITESLVDQTLLQLDYESKTVGNSLTIPLLSFPEYGSESLFIFFH